MQRFFFHMRNRGLLVEDPEGMVLPNPALACIEALENAQTMLSHDLAREDLWEGWQFEVADAAGQLLAVVPFNVALQLR